MKNRTQACLATILFALLCIEALGADDIPAVLLEWKDAAYTQRFFLRVEAPGEAGNVDLIGDPPAASVLLPLRMLTPEGQPKVPEALLLIGEDGQVQQILARPAPGNMGVEVAFPTRPGLRRYCLYAGAPNGMAENASLLGFQPSALGVRLRGRAAPLDFRATDKPLTLERFRALEERPEGILSVKTPPLINDVECPWFNIRIDASGNIQGIDNPQRYTALYEAFLRAPVSGTYRFSVDTLGVAHLLIDGKPIVSADMPDKARIPFALNNTVELQEGIHRVTLYYSEANKESRSNADLSHFGVRLLWQPPFSKMLGCVPAQAFVRALPAVVTRAEGPKGGQPFIHFENVGQVRVATHQGEIAEQELVLLSAKGSGGPVGTTLRVVSEGREIASGSENFCAWVPAGKPLELQIVSGGGSVYSRKISLPTVKQGAHSAIDLEGELVIKSAPEFLYPDETGHIHLEALLSPSPVIVPKERMEKNMLPPAPRPLGQFQLSWRIETNGVPVEHTEKPIDATPLEAGRKKVRVSVPADDLIALAANGQSRLMLTMQIGDATAQTEIFRVLHSRSEKLPGALNAAPGSLSFTTDQKTSTGAKSATERVLMIVPREDEREYRQFLPLKAVVGAELGKDALFLGDPLVEGESTDSKKALPGLADRIARSTPDFTWKAVAVSGPHRYLPIFQMIGKLDGFVREQPDGKIPALVIVSLGAGDAARQTPLHIFERALDALIDRLRAAGARKIVIIGVIPEPTRDNQAEPYQARVADILRQHHIDGVDLLGKWTKESDWSRRFSVEGEGESVFGAVPNSQTLDEIVQALKSAL
jgi:hypothetical protein